MMAREGCALWTEGKAPAGEKGPGEEDIQGDRGLEATRPACLYQSLPYIWAENAAMLKVAFNMQGDGDHVKGCL